MTIVTVVLWLVAAVVLALWLGRTWSSTTLRGDTTRKKLITSGVDAVVALAFVRAVAPPPGAWSWSWPIAAGIVGLGLAGAIRQWSALPWRKPKQDPHASAPRARAVAGTAAYAVVGAALVALLA